MLKVNLPLDSHLIRKLRARDELFLNGIIYTARDQAHKRLVELLKKGKRLPIDLKKATIYYCGPNPGRGKLPIGSCGPTTASRMDDLTIPLMRAGLKIMIGKGERCPAVRSMIKAKHGVYLLAPAGCGALLAKKVTKAKLAAFGDLKSEGIYALKVHNFPVIVGIDSRGRDIYQKRR
jgi:fumarate hydratase subunit beta